MTYVNLTVSPGSQKARVNISQAITILEGHHPKAPCTILFGSGQTFTAKETYTEVCALVDAALPPALPDTEVIGHFERHYADTPKYTTAPRVTGKSMEAVPFCDAVARHAVPPHKESQEARFPAIVARSRKPT